MYRRYLLLFIVLSISVVGFSASIPLPKRNKTDSLVMIVVCNKTGISVSGKYDFLIKGSLYKKIHPGKDPWKIEYLRLPAGRYILSSSMGLYKKEIEILPNTIVLLEYRLTVNVLPDGSPGTVFELLNEEDRQKAAEDLALYIDFTAWAGREFEGFGSVKPSLQKGAARHELVLNSEPQGAEVFLDDVFIGQTPLTFLTDTGKHQLLLKLDGYLDDIRYLSLNRSAEINAKLEKSEKRALKDVSMKYRTLVVPFYKAGGEGDDMSALLSDSLVPVLKEDSRVEVITGSLPWEGYGSLIQPDFTSSSLMDIDLIATGVYTKQEDTLEVSAVLYDVRTEAVKAGITWEGPVDLGIFDALDEISLSFRNEVDRVLPEAGKILIRKKHIVYSGMSPIDARIERKRLVQRRVERENTFTLISGMSVDFITVTQWNADKTSSNTFYPSNGPGYPVFLEYERYLSEFFSFSVGMEFINPYMLMYPDPDKNYTPWLISLLPSARVVVRGVKSDFLLGVGPALRILTGDTASWDDGEVHTADVGPVLIAGLQMNTGFRIYLNKRIDEIPKFIFFGFSLGMPEFCLNFSNMKFDSGSSQLGLYLGGGFTL